VPYSDLLAQAGVTRFVENEHVPSDGTQVGTTWRFVAKHGGPDRRFNNNRQLPIMLYGELRFTSHTGVRELFHCSIPGTVSQVSETLAGFKSSAQSRKADVSFAAPGKDNLLLRVGLWVAVVLIGLVTMASFDGDYSAARAQEREAARLRQQRTEETRQQFVLSLNNAFRNKHVNNVTATATDDQLTLRFTNELSKPAKRDGLKPFEKTTFFAKIMAPNTETTLCSTGFRVLKVAINNDPASISNLICPFNGTQ
jgi:hypothetical protein